MKTLNPYSRIILVVSSLLLVSAYFVPVWQILMWAPQYPEGLDMKIWIDNITGDVKIISALNHYIGMRHIDVSMFPEFTYMKYIVGLLIAIGLLSSIINKRFVLVAYAVSLIVCGAAALVDFYLWGYDYGHNLDPKAPIVVPGMSYQPPVIGTKQLLNFTAFSGPDTGGWIFLISGLLAIGVSCFEIFKGSRTVKAQIIPGLAFIICLMMTSCSVEPEPLQYGKDACHACKMTLMDNKFGAEVVSRKGKIFKFDDANCLVNFLNSGHVAQQDIEYCLITDFSSPGSLIDAKTAFYVKSEAIKSPMASNIAAFQNRANLKGQNDARNGIELTWGELVTEYK